MREPTPTTGDTLELALLQLHERVVNREWPAVKLAVALLPNLVERRPSLPIATTNILTVSDALRASGEITVALMQGRVTEKVARSAQAAIKNFADLASAQRLENLERMVSEIEKESRSGAKGGALLIQNSPLYPSWMKAPGEDVEDAVLMPDEALDDEHGVLG